MLVRVSRGGMGTLTTRLRVDVDGGRWRWWNVPAAHVIASEGRQRPAASLLVRTLVRTAQLIISGRVRNDTNQSHCMRLGQPQSVRQSIVSAEAARQRRRQSWNVGDSVAAT